MLSSLIFISKARNSVKKKIKAHSADSCKSPKVFPIKFLVTSNGHNHGKAEHCRDGDRSSDWTVTDHPMAYTHQEQAQSECLHFKNHDCCLFLDHTKRTRQESSSYLCK